MIQTSLFDELENESKKETKSAPQKKSYKLQKENEKKPSYKTKIVHDDRLKIEHTLELKPTQEQNEIIKALEVHDVIKILAFAGTGKTTTLQMVANIYKNSKILYLAFNKGIQLEASKKFPKNVTVKTTHALAYGIVKKRAPKIRMDRLKNYRVAEISRVLSISYQDAATVNIIFNNWCNSSSLEITPESETDYHKIYAKEFAELMENGEIEPTHSYYLKKYQIMLRKENLKTAPYDIILLDEAQDTNDVTLDIFHNISARKRIYVGDRHQQIYSFRGTKNALEKLKGTQMYLTESFRFPNSIADDANRFLKLMKKEDKRIVSRKAYDSSMKYETICYISRTNGELVQEIAKTIEEENQDKFYTVRAPADIFNLSIEVHYFLSSEHDMIIQNRFLLNFENEDDLRSYIEETEDTELKTSLRLANEYKTDLLTYLEISQKNYQNQKLIKKPKVLTTAHTAKGLEWDKVILADDFYDYASILAGNNYQDIYDFYDDLNQDKVKQEIIDEINLFYVAITRAKKYLDYKKCSAYDYVRMDYDDLNRKISYAYQQLQQKR